MLEATAIKPRVGLPELLNSPTALITTNNSFKKTKSNSINVIDFESTLSSKNRPVYSQTQNALLFKRKEFLNKKQEPQSSENRHKDMNNSLYKYLEGNPVNNYNSTHYSNLDSNSIKTKETNGASTNHETNRHSVSVIFNLKNNGSPGQTKEQPKPYNLQQGNAELKKKLNSNSIGNLTIDHIVRNAGNPRPPVQGTKLNSRTENLIKPENNEKKEMEDRIRKTQVLTASLYNDFRHVFEFRRDIAKNKNFVPNLKYPALFFEEKEKPQKQPVSISFTGFFLYWG